MPVSPLLYDIIVDVLVNALRQDKKRFTDLEERGNTFFIDSMIAYRKIPKN